jgi:antirestriction protein ArdC
MLKDLYQEVTDKILEQLKKDVAPWMKPWKSKAGSSGIPVNRITGNTYNGVNIVLLWNSADEHGFETNEWASFKQWAEKKEYVRKGEKGTQIVYADVIERPDKDNEGEIKRIPFLKSSYVFNRCQLNSYDPAKEEMPEERPLVNRIEAVDVFVKNTGAVIEYGGNVACYIPSEDKIKIPDITSFVDLKDCTGKEAFYSAELHELGHWTGAPNRLNREVANKFGNEKYAKEELVAELTAAFACAEFQIEKQPVENHAAYIEGWSKKLKDEPKTFITAASKASQAMNYLHGLQPQQSQL